MNLLVLFSKYPRIGHSKTRLAAGIGEEKALFYHKKFVSKLISEHKFQEYDFIVSTTSDEEAKQFSREFGVLSVVQQGSSLGERMYNTFKEYLKEYSSVIIIGSDIPDLLSDDVMRAFKSLEKTSVVIGPSNDGGYYLLGLNKLEDIFSGIEFSTSSVFQKTFFLIMKKQLPFTILKKRRDIDTKEDLDYYLSEGKL